MTTTKASMMSNSTDEKTPDEYDKNASYWYGRQRLATRQAVVLAFLGVVLFAVRLLMAGATTPPYSFVPYVMSGAALLCFVSAAVTGLIAFNHAFRSSVAFRASLEAQERQGRE